MSWQLISSWKRKAAAVRERLETHRYSERAIGEAQGYLIATELHIQSLAKSLNAKSRKARAKKEER